MGAKYTRASLEGVFFKSPFDGLRKHSQLIKEATEELKKGIQHYIEEDYVMAEKSFKKVSAIEHEADKVKLSIRENLPSFIFMPIRREDFLHLLKEADSILDYAKDVGVLLHMREEPIPDFVKDKFKIFSEKVFSSVEKFEELMSAFSELLETSFGRKSKEDVRRLHREIGRLEFEADKVEKDISRDLFNYDDSPLTAVHLLKVVDRMDAIADHAENVGDMIDSILESR